MLEPCGESSISDFLNNKSIGRGEISARNQIWKDNEKFYPESIKLQCDGDLHNCHRMMMVKKNDGYTDDIDRPESSSPSLFPLRGKKEKRNLPRMLQFYPPPTHTLLARSFSHFHSASHFSHFFTYLSRSNARSRMTNVSTTFAKNSEACLSFSSRPVRSSGGKFV